MLLLRAGEVCLWLMGDLDHLDLRNRIQKEHQIYENTECDRYMCTHYKCEAEESQLGHIRKYTTYI